jgi:hypothetical protein
VLVELHLSKVYVQLYGVKQVASLCWLQIDCLVLVIVRTDYILPSLVQAIGPYLSRLDDSLVRASRKLVRRRIM